VKKYYRELKAQCMKLDHPLQIIGKSFQRHFYKAYESKIENSTSERTRTEYGDEYQDLRENEEEGW
jgi:hypothetical protein